MFAKYFSIIAAAAAVAFAYTTPTVQCTDGCNPIGHPGLLEAVPAGTTYNITWKPTTPGTVTILLLRGPATNLVVLFPIVEKIPNNGLYSWAVPTTLEPDTARYGIQLINDADGTFQYSTQFGISNPSYSSSSISTSTSTTSTSSSLKSSSSAVPIYPAGNTTSAPYYPTGSVYSSGSVYTNTSIIFSTGSMTVPVTLQTSATSTKATALPSSAAGTVKMSISGAVVALMAAVAVL